MKRQIALPMILLIMVSSSLSGQVAEKNPDSKDKRILALEKQLREEKDLRRLYERNRRMPSVAESSPEDAVEPFAQRPKSRILATSGLAAPRASSPFSSGRVTFWSKTKKELAIENKISELVQSIQKSDDDTEKESIKSELKAQLELQYDDYLAKLEKPLKEMEARLEKLRTEYQKRKDARDELVKLRLDNFWYKANGMGWPGDNSRFPRNSNFSRSNVLLPSPSRSAFDTTIERGVDAPAEVRPSSSPRKREK